MFGNLALFTNCEEAQFVLIACLFFLVLWLDQKRTESDMSDWPDYMFAKEMEAAIIGSVAQASRRSKFGQWRYLQWPSLLICSCANREDGDLGQDGRHWLRTMLRQVGGQAAYSIRSAQWEARLADGTTVKATFFATGKDDTFAADGHCTSADLDGAVKFCFCGQLAAAFTASPPRLWEVDATVHPPRSIGKIAVPVRSPACGSCAEWRASRPPSLQMPMSTYHAGRFFFDAFRARLLRRCFRAAGVGGGLCSVLPQLPAARRAFMLRMGLFRDNGAPIRRQKPTCERVAQKMIELIGKEILVGSRSVVSQLRDRLDPQTLQLVLTHQPKLRDFLLRHDSSSVEYRLPSAYDLLGEDLALAILERKSAVLTADSLRARMFKVFRDALFREPEKPRIWLAGRWQINENVAAVIVSRGAVWDVKVVRVAGKRRGRSVAADDGELEPVAAAATPEADNAFIYADARILERLERDEAAPAVDEEDA
jgi:hypothetical protein